MVNIMTRAWEVAKEGQIKFGGSKKEYIAESLKIVWNAVKTGETAMAEVVAIKDWFIDKNFDSNEAYAVRTADFKVLKQTEKAYRLKAMTDFGNLFFWVPKSVCMNHDQFVAECDKARNAFHKGLERNIELLKQAKEMGVKGVRKGMRTVTLEKKIAQFKAAV